MPCGLCAIERELLGTIFLLLHFWIKAIFKLPMASRFFFGQPGYSANLPGLSLLQYIWHHEQDPQQMGMEPTAPPEGEIEGWPTMSMWYFGARLLSTWALPQGWPEVGGKLICVEKTPGAGRDLQQGTHSHGSWGHGVALSYSLAGRVGSDSARSSISLGTQD